MKKEKKNIQEKDLLQVDPKERPTFEIDIEITFRNMKAQKAARPSDITTEIMKTFNKVKLIFHLLLTELDICSVNCIKKKLWHNHWKKCKPMTLFRMSENGGWMG